MKWKSIYDGWALHTPPKPRRNDAFVNYLLLHFAELGKNDNILEVGAHECNDALKLQAGLQARVFSLDISLRSLQACKIIPRVVGSACCLPFSDSSYTVIVACNLIHLLDNREDFFSEASRTLKCKGSIVLLTSLGKDLNRPLINQYFPSIEKMDKKRYGSKNRLVEELLAANFSNITNEKILLRREHVDERFIRVIKQRTWSSLLHISEKEYRAGLDRLLTDYKHWQKQGNTPTWDNYKTVVYAEKT